MIKKNLLSRFIAEALIFKISEKGLTQKDIAIYLDVSESFLSDVIYGRKKFNLRHVYLIIEKLDICPSFLFPNKDTFDLIKSSLGYEDFNKFFDEMNNEFFKEESVNE